MLASLVRLLTQAAHSFPVPTECLLKSKMAARHVVVFFAFLSHFNRLYRAKRTRNHLMESTRTCYNLNLAYV